MSTHPFGTCQCGPAPDLDPRDQAIVDRLGGGCCGGTGPAAFEVTRDGVRMKVCSRCDLSSDKDKSSLIPTERRSEVARVFAEHDPIFGMLFVADDS